MSWIQYHNMINSCVFWAEFLLCPVDGSSDNTSEACRFLSTVLFSQQFLQVRPSNTRQILPNRKLTFVASQVCFCKLALFLFCIPEWSTYLLNPSVPCWQGFCLYVVVLRRDSPAQRVFFISSWEYGMALCSGRRSWIFSVTFHWCPAFVSVPITVRVLQETLCICWFSGNCWKQK